MPEAKSVNSAFEGAATGRDLRRDHWPSPSEVAASGIKTREALDWLSRQDPDVPAPARDIDDEALRQEAKQEARARAREAANALRAEFRERSRKGRKDFETARAWRGTEYER